MRSAWMDREARLVITRHGQRLEREKTAGSVDDRKTLNLALAGLAGIMLSPVMI